MTRCWEDLKHFSEDVRPAFLGLLKRFGHQRRRESGNLDIHLQSGDALLCSGNLEIHVAEVVLQSLDIAENNELLAVRYQSHGDPGNGRRNGNTGVHQRQGRTTHRGHGSRAVRRHTLGNQA